MLSRLQAKIHAADEFKKSGKYAEAIVKYSQLELELETTEFKSKIEKLHLQSLTYYGLLICYYQKIDMDTCQRYGFLLQKCLTTILSSAETKNKPEIAVKTHEIIIKASTQITDLFPFKKIKTSYEFVKKHNSSSAEKMFLHYTTNYYISIEGNLQTALSYAKKLIALDDIEYKVYGYLFGAIIKRMDGKFKESAAFIDPVIELYFNNKALLAPQKAIISEGIYNIAVIYDSNDAGDLDPIEAMRYYRIAALLDSAMAYNNMAHKYVVGEDVPQDVDKAIKYFRKAYELGLSQALTDWSAALSEYQPTDVSEIIPLAEKEGLHKAYHNIGLCYFLAAKKDSTDLTYIADTNFLSISELEQNQSNNWDPELIQKAIVFFQKGYDAGSPNSAHNIGLIYQFGLGVEKNILTATKFYMISAKRGNLLSKQCLLKILHSKEKKQPIDEFQAKSAPLTDFFKVSQKEEEKKLELKEAEEALTQLNLNTNNRINNIINDYQTEAQDKIKQFLEVKIDTLDAKNTVLTVHQVGRETEKCLPKRSFHEEVLPRVLQLIETLNKHLAAKNIASTDHCNIVKGLTKLHLDTKIPALNNAVHNLYSQVSSNLQSYSLSEIINMIFSSIRLNEHAIFEKIIPAMISYVQTNLSQLSQLDAGNLLYALAVLNCNNKIVTDPNSLDKLFKPALKLFRFFEANEEKLTDNEKLIASLKEINEEYINILLHQIYLALSYFSSKYPELKKDSNLAFAQEKLLNYFTARKNKSYESNTQKQVIKSLKLYVKDIDPEKLVNTLPVDAYVALNDTENFILEVDGPSHYNHDEKGTPVESQKQQFRNAILQLADASPLIIVPTLDWDKQKQKHDYLKSVLSKKNLILPDTIRPEFNWRTRNSCT